MQKNQPPKVQPPGATPDSATQESNQYDKVFKEALREGLPVLMTEILKIPAGDFKPVHLELQRTIERKADFIGKLVAPDLPKTIAHLEVQAKDAHKMVLRTYFYSGLIVQQYPDWDLLQCVFYIGKKRPKMPTVLKKSGIDYHFRLIWIKDIPYREFLKTNKPEIMLLGLLAGYGNKSAQEVLTEVVHKIRQKTPSELDFQHRVQQLHILSNLHQIQHIFENVMLNISEFIDERKDPFFQRGEKIGIEKGIEKDIEKGIEKVIEPGF